jgi:hypothetical protein
MWIHATNSLFVAAEIAIKMMLSNDWEMHFSITKYLQHR